jgi:hypothetical protein
VATATLRPTAPEWRAGPDGVGHAIERNGDVEAACREIVVPQWAVAIRERCPACLDKVGVVVSLAVPPRPWSE